MAVLGNCSKGIWAGSNWFDLVLGMGDKGILRDDTQGFSWWIIQEDSTGRRADLAIEMFSALGVESLKYWWGINI